MKDLRIVFIRRDGTVLRAVGADVSNAKVTLKYVERNCFFNAVQNLRDMEKVAGTELALVAGSLGLCSPSPCWYEWGGDGPTPHQTVARFVKCPITGMQDAHFWLESRDGIVYDVLDAYLMEVVAPFHGKKVDTSGFAHGVLVRGSKEELEKIGLKYVPATELVQTCLINVRMRRNKLI